MPSLFRRRSTDLFEVPDQATGPTAAPAEEDAAGTPEAEVGQPDAEVGQPEAEVGQPDAEVGQPEADAARPRGYTPSKRELGVTTPKRPSAHPRRPGVTPAGGHGKLTKEEKQELREARRAHRREVSDGMRRGDPRYLAARDQGPERAIARDVVDTRRTAGTWFFGAALVILLASSTAIPVVVTVANALFLTLTLALVVDSVLISRRIRQLVRARHPDSTHSMIRLYGYALMRAITFRRLRIPLPRKKFGEPV